MSDNVVTSAAHFAFAAAPAQKAFKFLWHAGEPLTAGIEFYERAFAEIARVAPSGVTVTHSIQTNGTLVNEQWCKLFKRFQVHIGLSIDGPASLHDRQRKSWNGRGSHDRVMRGYAFLQKYDIYPGAICVLTSDSLKHPEEIYRFFIDNNFRSIAFNVDEAEGSNTKSSFQTAPFDAIESSYRTFMRRLWSLWRSDNEKIEIREFKQELACIRDLMRDPDFIREPDEVLPLAIITVSKEGDLSTFAPELASTSSAQYQNFVIGNVLRDEYADIVRCSNFIEISKDIARGRAACRNSCSYFALCGGGFQSNRFAEHGSLSATETTTCRVQRKVLLDVIVDELTTETKKRLGHADFGESPS